MTNGVWIYTAPYNPGTNAGEANPYLTPDIAGYVSVPVDFQSAIEFDRARITFAFDPDLLEDRSFVPAIYYFNEEEKMLELLDNQELDRENAEVGVDVTHFSTYILLNKTAFDAVWEREMKPPYSDILEDLNLAISFSLDSSGSMAWNDPEGLRKETAKAFIDKLNADDKAAVIDFDSYATVLCPLTTDKERAKAAVDRVNSLGGTNLTAGIGSAINQLRNDQSTSKYIILLTDGQGTYDPDLTIQAIFLDIEIYTIGLGDDVDEALLRQIALDTGGKYYHAATYDDLEGIFDEASEETIDLNTDTDGDGLTDYHEKKGMRTSTGQWIYTNPLVADTDGDGLLDGQEMRYNGNDSYVMKSHPRKTDTDNDGISDKIDPEPTVYSITDMTLAKAAQLSYTNLFWSIGQKVGNRGQKELSEFKIVGANDCYVISPFDYFDKGFGCVAIKISRPGKKDALIYAIRGTDIAEDFFNDFGTDILLGVGVDTTQSKKAFNEYKKLAKKYPNADIYITGHSLGGRLVQDVLYKTYNNNYGNILFQIKEPAHAATFNGLGYNKFQFFMNGIFKQGVINKIQNKLNNYYMKKDAVGELLGNSVICKRLGIDVGPWIAFDKTGNAIPIPSGQYSFEPANVHGIELFFSQNGLKYPNCKIY